MRITIVAQRSGAFTSTDINMPLIMAVASAVIVPVLVFLLWRGGDIRTLGSA